MAVGRLLLSIGNSPTLQQSTVHRQEIPKEEETCSSCMQRQEARLVTSSNKLQIMLLTPEMEGQKRITGWDLAGLI
jgi:hypothetical protein